MTYDPERHHRKSIRLKGYDYTQAGAYFVTLVTQDRACLFGEVVGEIMCPNDAGRMVQTVWDELPIFYPGVLVDESIVMPNHVHGIVVLVGAAPRGRPGSIPAGRPDLVPAGHPDLIPVDCADLGGCAGAGSIGEPGPGQARGPAPTDTTDTTGTTGTRSMALADVVHRFKTMTTKRYSDDVKHSGWPPFRGRLWQRNYYEHIMRDEAELDRVRCYIRENPSRWEADEENPVKVPQ